MARYEHLKIYQTAYKFLLNSMVLIKSFPNDYKYTLGKRIQNSALDLLVNIYKANNANDKTPFIDVIIECSMLLNVFLRVAFDVKVINELKYAEFSEQVIIISKQAKAWRENIEE